MKNSTKHAHELNREDEELTSLRAFWVLRSWRGKMSSTKRLVLYAIIAHLHEECEGFASYSQLAAATGLNRRTITSTLPKLFEDAGPFVLTTYARGELRAHGYRISLRKAETSAENPPVEGSPGLTKASSVTASRKPNMVQN